jgi:hypothetical protein
MTLAAPCRRQRPPALYPDPLGAEEPSPLVPQERPECQPREGADEEVARLALAQAGGLGARARAAQQRNGQRRRQKLPQFSTTP